MQFINKYDIGDIISAIMLITVILGGIWGFIQWQISLKIKKAEYINELTQKIRTDTDIKDIIYLFDYGIDWYNRNFHGDSELELKVDRTLSYFSYICYLRKRHLIARNEFMFFKYEIERILANKNVQEYFYNLYHFSKKFRIPFTFYYLFEYGRKHNFFNSEFYNNRSEYYPHYLNF